MTEQRDTDWGECVALGIGVACVAVVLLSIWPGWAWVADMFSRDGAPAWVQAVGSVAAICVAVWVPWRQKKISDAERKASEKLLAQLAALATVNHIDLLTAGVRGLREALHNSEGTLPNDGMLNFMLATVDSIELPSDKDILRLSSISNGVHLNLIQLSVKWRHGRSFLALNCRPGNGEDSWRLVSDSLNLLYKNLLDLSGMCMRQLREFLEVECGMTRNPDAPQTRG